MSEHNRWDVILNQAIAIAHTGDRARARALLHRVIRQGENADQAWFLLALMAETPHQARVCLQQVLRINPAHRRALYRLQQIEQELTQERRWPLAGLQARSNPGAVARWWPLVLSAVVLVVLGGWAVQAWGDAGPAQLWRAWLAPTATFVPTPSPAPSPTMTPTGAQRVGRMIPELEQAWGARDWQVALGLLNQVVLIDPAYPGLTEARCDTLRHWAQDAVAQGQIDRAYLLYRQGTELCPAATDLAEGRSLALTYLMGLWRYDHQRWREAAAVLSWVYEVAPTWGQTRELLHSAYLGWAQVAVQEGELDQAQAAAEAALALVPEDEATRALLAQVKARLAPTPTPVQQTSASGKRIEVNLSQQRMYVWQGDTLLYNWVCSSGEPGRNTATGHFQVLNKIPEAWASTWSLRMPYWLGIYQAGPLQNGIHALPILPDGRVLWAGYLGTPVSYGCIILSTENARTLYNWAEIGTPVWIHY